MWVGTSIAYPISTQRIDTNTKIDMKNVWNKGLFKDHAGEQYGVFKVVSQHRVDGKNNRYWLCECDKGHQRHVASWLLKTLGECSTCRSQQHWEEYRAKKKVERERSAKFIKHGHSNVRGKGNGSKEYNSWAAMQKRCYLKKKDNYMNYGGRGIRVAESWRGKYGFITFLKDIGPAPSSYHTLDRLDPDGNYEPGNVRWATPNEQANNKRNSAKRLQLINHYRG